MSLFRQLWLTIILVTLISFSGSFAVSLLSTRSYLEQQLHRKNVDSANSLAHSISRLSKDPATVGLQIDAFFNSGQYETISITAPDGTVITERVAGPVETGVPAWFVDLLPISAPAGQAQIPDSWMHFGVIKVVSSIGLAHQALWEQTETLLPWFLAAGILCGFIGMLILQRINKPLGAMVAQAEAITERRFLTVSEPRIAELRSIARAMNDLVRRLHNRTLEEALRLDVFQQQINHDPITGLATREYFMSRFGALLEPEEALPDVKGQGESPTQGNAGAVAEAGSEAISASGAGEATPGGTTLGEAELTEPVQEPVRSRKRALSSRWMDNAAFSSSSACTVWRRSTRRLATGRQTVFCARSAISSARSPVTGAAKPPVTWPRASTDRISPSSRRISRMQPNSRTA